MNEEEVIEYFNKNIDKEERNICPTCGSINILARKTLSPKYRCNHCKELFEEHGDEIEKETLITVIDEYLRYISLEDTVTFCKKCAFLWDKKGMDLCPVCKEKYKSIYNKTCYNCR